MLDLYFPGPAPLEELPFLLIGKGVLVVFLDGFDLSHPPPAISRHEGAIVLGPCVRLQLLHDAPLQQRFAPLALVVRRDPRARRLLTVVSLLLVELLDPLFLLLGEHARLAILIHRETAIGEHLRRVGNASFVRETERMNGVCRVGMTGEDELGRTEFIEGVVGTDDTIDDAEDELTLTVSRRSRRYNTSLAQAPLKMQPMTQYDPCRLRRSAHCRIPHFPAWNPESGRPHRFFLRDPT